MSNFVKKVVYAGLDQEKIRATRQIIAEENRRYVVIYSSIVAGGMALLLFLSLFVDVLVSSRAAYVAAIVVGLILLAISNGPAKEKPGLTAVCQYTLVCALLAFGIYLGTLVEPNQASASYAVLLFVAPLLFTDLPLRINFLTALSIVIYIFAARASQDDAMFAFNMSIVMPYGLTNLVITYFTSKMKIERNIYAQEKKVLSEIDQLTGLRNRRSFENDATALSGSKDIQRKIAVGSFDVNGLKAVNDTLGHKAGDELLVSASRVLEDVVGKYGSCYRVGGDEFMAIFDIVPADPDEVIARIHQEAEGCHGSYDFKLSISCGIVEGSSKGIRELVHQADALMYQHKREYYAAKARDSKGQSQAEAEG